MSASDPQPTSAARTRERQSKPAAFGLAVATALVGWLNIENSFGQGLNLIISEGGYTNNMATIPKKQVAMMMIGGLLERNVQGYLRRTHAK